MEQLNLNSFGFNRGGRDLGSVFVDSLNDTLRFVVGAHGKFGDGWQTNIYYERSEGRVRLRTSNNPIHVNIYNAVDAVVNPANSQGIMEGGVAGTLRDRGGEEIEAEARSLAPIAVGAAVVTGPGSLFCKHVIHAPTMEQPGMKIGVENVRRATRAALLAADVLSLDTIAMPGMGTGVGRVPVDEAARAMVDEIRSHRRPKPTTIYLVGTKDAMLFAFEEALKNAANPM